MSTSAADSQVIYKRRLDKWRSRSTRLFNRAQNLNRTLDRQLSTAIKDLENTRDIAIRRDQEKIWMVNGAGLHAPKYSRTEEDQPAYLGKQMNATLPTPQELSSLLPNKKAKKRTQSTGYYMQMSRRRLSSMNTGDLNIVHYRKALETLRGQHATSAIYGEVINEDAEDTEQNGYALNETQAVNTDNRWAEPTGLISTSGSQKTGVQKQRPKTALSTKSSKPSNPQRPKTAIPASGRKKQREIVPNAAALMIEQAQNPNNKVLRTNFLDMYQTQLAKHQRRMSTLQERRGAPKSAPPNRRQGTTEEPSTRLTRPATAIGLEGEAEDVFDDESTSRLMAETASSSMRSRSPLSIKQKLRRTSLAAISGMTSLHGEVKSLQSYRKFKRESLCVVENDIPNMGDLQEGELFDEMRKVRYLRWGEDEEKVTELNEDQPLVNQLKTLTIDTTKKPKRFLKKVKEQHEPNG